MSTVPFKNANTRWVVSAVALAAVLGLIIMFNPLNTTATQWVGPSKTAAPASTTSDVPVSR
jgi:hypothetical protein